MRIYNLSNVCSRWALRPNNNLSSCDKKNIGKSKSKNLCTSLMWRKKKHQKNVCPKKLCDVRPKNKDINIPGQRNRERQLHLSRAKRNVQLKSVFCFRYLRIILSSLFIFLPYFYSIKWASMRRPAKGPEMRTAYRKKKIRRRNNKISKDSRTVRS